MKRLTDIILSLIGLIIAIPIFLATALLIKINSKGPVLFIQDRVGKNGLLFKIIKFRTMVENASAVGPTITQKNDMRITSIGLLLRWFKIDELPQLINVLKGDLSLIGPRPEVPKIVERNRAAFEEILKVKPGVIGPSQIIGRDELSKFPEKFLDTEEYYEKVILPEKLNIDRQYVRNVSFWNDLKYLIRGVWVTVFGSIKLQFLLRSRSRIAMMLIDAVCIQATYLFAFLLRFDFSIPAHYWVLYLQVSPILVFTTLIFLIYFGVYQKLWAFVEIKNLAAIVEATLLAAGSMFVVFFFAGIRSHPRSIILIYLALVVNLLLLTRITIRAIRRHSAGGIKKEPARKAVVVGLGENPGGALYHLLHDNSLKSEIIGFVDNDDKYRGMTLENLKVLGKMYDIPQILKTFDVTEVLVLSENVSNKDLQFINGFCRGTEARVRIIPTIGDLMDDTFQVSRARDLDITDLLGRKPVKLDLSDIEHLIQGKKIFVSGAGGSIGSELCRQIGEFKPAQLIIVDKSENYLHDILLDLKEMFPGLEVIDFNTSITNQRKLDHIFSKYRPHAVFHSAAHKHVPLSESNPDEAVINNIYATRILALTAHWFGVETFVMVSTDKAVNATSVMGATKRIAELFIQNLSKRSPSRFITIRFGNVLGSNGSVVQIFKKQIERGGPVTITDPEMTRYFMTIPEACQLILQATAIGESGQILMLDMGEPVRIMNLAHEMIKLYGLKPGEDIEIKIVGIRPGEKLEEELSFDSEEITPTKHAKIKILASNGPSFEDLDARIDELYRLSLLFDVSGIIDKMNEILPGFRPQLRKERYSVKP